MVEIRSENWVTLLNRIIFANQLFPPLFIYFAGFHQDLLFTGSEAGLAVAGDLFQHSIELSFQLFRITGGIQQRDIRFRWFAIDP